MLTEAIIDTLLLIGILATLLVSVGAKVLRNFSHRRLEIRCRARRRRERFNEILQLHDDVALAVEKLQMGLLVVVTASVAMVVRDDVANWSTAQRLGGGLLALFLVWTVTLWIPWAVVRHASAGFLLNTWWLWRLVDRGVRPFRWGGILFDAVLRRLAGQPKLDDKEQEEEDFEDEILTMVNAGQRDGLLEADAREMIEGVIELGDADVADIMTPRSQVDALDVDSSLEQILEVVVESGRTRLPIYEKSMDNVIGILYVKELLPHLVGHTPQQQISLRKILRDPWYVSRTVPVDDLLQDFLKNRMHLAVVLDEYGAFEGVVTIEDALEEIVGEIMDESDELEEEGITFFNEHRSKVMGTVHVDLVSERLGVHLPESDEFDTVGGFVIRQLGHIPKPGESVEYGDVRFTVAEATARKLISVLVETTDATEMHADAN